MTKNHPASGSISMARSIWATKSASVRVGPIDGLTTLPITTSKFAIIDSVAVADVLVPRGRAERAWFLESLERLHARLVTGAHHVRARHRKLRSVTLRVADVLDAGLI